MRHDVKEFEPHPKGGYVVRYRDLTDYEGVDAKHAPRGELRCKVLVVSAGALGSTYLMLENQQRLGGLSSALGTKFCGNGDLLGFVRTRDGRVLAGTRGPVITSTMRVDDELDPGGAGTGRGFYLQDGGYPGFADWIIETTSLPNRLWRSLKLGATLFANRLRHHRTNHLSLAVSQLVGASSISSGSLPMLGMGRDVPDGVMRLDDDWLEIDWNVESSREYFSRVKQLMEQVAQRARRRTGRQPDLVAEASGDRASARRLPDGHPRRVAAGRRAGRTRRRRRPRRGVRPSRVVRGRRIGDAGSGRRQSLADHRRAGRAVQPADDRAGGMRTRCTADRGGELMKRALIMAGGGTKVAFQAGVLQVWLDEAGIEFDHADGASGGVFNLAMYCQGLSGTEIADNWRNNRPLRGVQPSLNPFVSLFRLDRFRRNTLQEDWGLDWAKIRGTDARGDVQPLQLQHP